MEKNITKLLIHISAADGYLSEVEIEKAYEELSNNYKITRNDFDSYVDEFFEETFSIEDYLMSLKDLSDPETFLKSCYKSAASDDFDIRENFAFSKTCDFFGIDPDLIIQDA
tara:strand:- start:11435 stop:11770 length:336 start_codon:yes stop_codon:yes gene_type:complete